MHPAAPGSIESAWRDEVATCLVELGCAGSAARSAAENVPAPFALERSPSDAAGDLVLVRSEGPRARLVNGPDGEALRLAWSARPSLSYVVSVLGRLGLDVLAHTEWHLPADDGATRRLDDFSLGADPRGGLGDRPGVVAALEAVLAGHADDDGFNQLVLAAGLPWREVTWVRCWYRYLKQTGLAFELPYVQQALVRNGSAVRHMVELFRARFDPDVVDGGARSARAAAGLRDLVDTVDSRDDARILSAGYTLMTAIVRTNAFLVDESGSPAPRMSIKVDPATLSWAPHPRPHREVFVHSPLVEGIHLRSTPVSRGGIRWSDRPEDLRTEVLGLVKAQQVKNAGIVPGGAKGGFVVRPAAGPAAVREAYGDFVRGLLDVTDNMDGGTVHRPARLVVHDGDDPYLVVAADKGTATFSDLANDVAAEYGYWLGDAFASGGSVGFDHKALGVTARGAWESLVRHLGERGVDPSRDAVTVAGIGDMSGDVFGNGLLLSNQLRLVAAFDHRHVFLDPDPDPATSWRERQRLAQVPGSSWDDYDRAVLSPDGLVHPRSARWVQLTPRIRAVLGVVESEMSTDQLIRAVLRAPVDVLFNGGVGTYVKASTETHADAGDPPRDRQRIDAAELRATVVVEGGNLGLTQRARIEYALAGGRVNTDFLDNAAGVNTSDREVNLKILLDADVASGTLDRAGRARRLREVAPEVVSAVLADNAAQARAVSIAEEEAPALLDRHRQLIRVLQRDGRLDPVVEHLPDDEELERRRARGQGLTRPELALLLGYSKDVVRDRLLAPGALSPDQVARVARTYLPAALHASTPFEQHPLHLEIAATSVANQMINRVGSSFLDRLEELTSYGTADVARAQMAVSGALGLDELYRQVESLDPARHARAQTALMLAVRRVLEGECLWLLMTSGRVVDVAAVVARYRTSAASVLTAEGMHHTAASRRRLSARARELAASGAPEEVARVVAAMESPFPILATSDLAADLGMDVARVARVHQLLGRRLSWQDLLDQATPRSTEDHVRHVAAATTRLGIEEQALSVVRRYLSETSGLGPDSPADIEAWLSERRAPVERYLATMGTLRSATEPDIAALLVATHELRVIAGPALAGSAR